MRPNRLFQGVAELNAWYKALASNARSVMPGVRNEFTHTLRRYSKVYADQLGQSKNRVRTHECEH
jgi:hypothetical protein